jgi:uncharacterized protein (TIGR03067 family)
MRLSVVVLLSVFGSLASAEQPQKDAVKKEVDHLQGTWVPESSNTEGKETPKAELQVLRLTVKGDRWLLSLKGGKPFVEPTFKVDPTAKPKTLDVVSATQKGKILLRAIYELEGDMLKLCYAIGDAERPKEFKSEARSKSGITVYKRVKE